MSNLTQAWTTASAALPLGWRLSLLQLDLVMPDGTEHWLAGAVEYDKRGFPMDHEGYYERGYGANPIQALLDLASKLAPLRGDPNG